MWSRSSSSTTGSRNCWRPLVDAATAATLAEVVTGRVGGFLRNVYGIGHAGTCDVCRGPATGSVCAQCSTMRATLDGATCDHTLTLMYAQGEHASGIHQSVHLMQSYKATPPDPRSMDNLRLIINVGTLLHGDCIRQELGHLWDSVTYVPSSRGRSGDHPVRNLARAVSQVADPEAGVERFLLSLGPGYSPGCSHVARRDRFAVSDEWQGAVRGKHVLVVDDTWTTGASIQSAAAALKLAGAESVTGLCAARWLKWSWPDHAALLGTCTSDYYALRCMVREGRCLVGRQP